MAKRWQLEALPIDRRIAKAVARHSDRRIELPAKAVTRLADDHFLLSACSVYWLVSRTAQERRRQDADHLLLTMAVAAAVPHLLKRIIAQERPDRVEIHGKRHGIPRSGKPYDAFPSGHAVHIGALASAWARAAPKHRALVWSLGAVVALTRVVLLAHWISDVIVGGAFGVAIETALNALRRNPGA